MSFAHVLFANPFYVQTSLLHLVNDVVRYEFVKVRDVNPFTVAGELCITRLTSLEQQREAAARFTASTRSSSASSSSNGGGNHVSEASPSVVVNQFKVSQVSRRTATLEFSSIQGTLLPTPISFTATLSRRQGTDRHLVWSIREPKSVILPTMTLAAGSLTSVDVVAGMGLTPLALLANMIEVEFAPLAHYLVSHPQAEQPGMARRADHVTNTWYAMQLQCSFLWARFGRTTPWIPVLLPSTTTANEDADSTDDPLYAPESYWNQSQG